MYEEEQYDFDWEAIEPAPKKPRDLATEVFTSSLHWIISFCISRPRHSKSKKTADGQANLRASYRRFLLDGRTISALAKELKVSRQEINKYIADVSLEFNYQGRNQHHETNRTLYRAAQLRKFAKANEKRKRKSINQPE